MDVGKILLAQIIFRIKAASFQQGILDAGSECPAEKEFQVQVVEVGEKTAGDRTAEVLQIIRVVFCRCVLPYFQKCVRKIGR